MGDMPGKTHRMRDTRFLSQFLEALPVIPVADDEIRNIRSTLQNPRQDADHPVVSFVTLRCREPRHCEKHSTSTKVVMLNEVLTFRSRSELQHKGIWQDPHVLRR